MPSKRIGVGIIGITPGQSWSATTHVPALRALAHDYEIVALSTTRQESAGAAAKLFGVPFAFDNYLDLVNHPNVDLVVVTVKVPCHFEPVAAAISAGKAVFCEWMLGKTLEESRQLAELAKTRRVPTAIGLQGRSSPGFAYVRDLIRQGYVGDVLSTSIIGSGFGWGEEVAPENVYVADRRNNVTMTSIVFGHVIDSICWSLGEFRQVDAAWALRRSKVKVLNSGELLDASAEDQLVVGGILESEAVISAHFRGGNSRGTSFLWEINGTEGDLQVTCSGQPQMSRLSIAGGQHSQPGLGKLAIPSHYSAELPEVPETAENIMYAYRRFASDFLSGTGFLPDFQAAAERHRLVDAVERAAATGQREML